MTGFQTFSLPSRTLYHVMLWETKTRNKIMSTGNRIISGNARSFVRYAIIKSSKNEKNAKKLTVLLIKICKVLPTIGMVLFGKHQVPRQRNTAVIKTCLTGFCNISSFASALRSFSAARKGESISISLYLFISLLLSALV